MNLLNLFEDSNTPGQNYAEELAYQIFKAAPDLDATGAADEVLDYAFDLAVNDFGKTKARALFAYDEDFDGDLVTAYAHLQRQGADKEQVNEVDPRNFDSDEDYYAARNAPAKRRSAPSDYPYSPEEDDAYFREIFRKKREAAKKAEQDKEQGVAEAGVGNRMSDMSVGSPKIVYKGGRAVGEIGIDHDPSPGNGPYYMKHYETNTSYAGYDTKKQALADLKHCIDQMNEGNVEKTATGLKHTSTDRYGAGEEPFHPRNPGKYARDLDHVNKQFVKDLDASMGVTWKNKGTNGVEVDENYSDEEHPIQNDTGVEAWGYAYNKRDQRVTWRKEFSSSEAAYRWADSKNATVVGMRPSQQAVSEADKKKEDEPEVRDVALQRAISRAKADFPTAGSGIEALAKGFMQGQDEDQKSFDQIRQAERRQDQMLAQISKIDQEQEQEIQGLEQQNSTLASRLQQLQSVNSELEKKLASMSGRRAEKQSKTDSVPTVAPVATTEPITPVAKKAAKTKAKAQPAKPSNRLATKKIPATTPGARAFLQMTPALSDNPQASLFPSDYGQDSANMALQQLKKDALASKNARAQDVDFRDVADTDALRKIAQQELSVQENNEKEVDYDDPRWDAMVKRVGQKAREQEKNKPVDIADLARRLAAIDASHKD